MFVHFKKMLSLTRGERGLVMAYAGVAAVAAGITSLVLSSLVGQNAIISESVLFIYWGITAGGVSAAVALYMLREWLGQPGISGLISAVFGSLFVAFVAASIAGTLIAPFSGTVMGPILLTVAFMSRPELAFVWVAVAVLAHYLLVVWNNERSLTKRPAILQLSRLTQLCLYRRQTSL